MFVYGWLEARMFCVASDPSQRWLLDDSMERLYHRLVSEDLDRRGFGLTLL